MSSVKGHSIVRLSELLTTIPDGKNSIKQFLLNFESPLNKDVENFLHEKAILFEEQGIARTHLVMASHKDNLVLVGYFSLANKSIVVKYRDVSSNLRKRLLKFGTNNAELKQINITSPLIGQLGKNFKYKGLISGDVLLKYACEAVMTAQLIIGGRTVYLECSDEEKLKCFYEENGFVSFGTRQLDTDEKNSMQGSLVQMLKYLN